MAPIYGLWTGRYVAGMIKFQLTPETNWERGEVIVEGLSQALFSPGHFSLLKEQAANRLSFGNEAFAEVMAVVGVRSFLLRQRAQMKDLRDIGSGLEDGTEAKRCINVATRAVWLATIGRLMWNIASNAEQSRASISFTNASNSKECLAKAKRVLEESLKALEADMFEVDTGATAADLDNTDWNTDDSIRTRSRDTSMTLYQFVLNGTVFEGQNPDMEIVQDIKDVVEARVGLHRKAQILCNAMVCFPDVKIECTSAALRIFIRENDKYLKVERSREEAAARKAKAREDAAGKSKNQDIVDLTGEDDEE